MDTRIYGLIVGIIGTSAFITILAGIAHFDIPDGFWAVLGGTVTLITTIVAVGSKKNGNGNGGAK